MKQEEIEKEKEYSLMNISQKAIIYDPAQDKFLLAKSVKGNGTFYSVYGPWEFFGGRLEKGEEASPSLLREIVEEAGDIKVTIKSLVSSYPISGPFGETMFLGYVTIFQGGEIELSHEHDEYCWNSAEEIKNNSEYKPWLQEFVAAADDYVKKDGYLEGWRRCMADFENYKKRQQENQKSLGEYLKEDSALQILPVIDNFRSATEHIPEEQKEVPWVTGIMYIQKQLEDILKENGVTEMEVKIGDEFNPNLHEAIADNTKDEKEFSNKIARVILKGYKLGEKVIRPARVVVE